MVDVPIGTGGGSSGGSERLDFVGADEVMRGNVIEPSEKKKREYSEL